MAMIYVPKSIPKLTWKSVKTYNWSFVVALAVLNVAGIPAALAQTPLPSAIPDPGLNKTPKPSQPPSDPDYIIPPRVAPNDEISAFTTTFTLNDIPISHLTQWQVSGVQAFADTTNSDMVWDGTFKLHAEVIESLSRTNIYRVDQRGSYLQLRTVPLERRVTTTTTQPQTMTGLEIQMSLTGVCFLPNAPRDQQCTYMPGLVIDRNSIDPDLFVPTRVFQTSQVGDILAPETLAFMELPGFQGGTASQPIGLDFYFPNSGTFPGNSQSQRSTIDRQEEIDLTIAGTFSRVRQVVKANDTQAVLGRTIHGFTLFWDDENRWLNTVIQAGAQLLPDFIPDLEGSENPANTRINRNLFFAANNTRLPSSSFTIYSAGLGRAESLTPNIRSLREIPGASYHSLWLGLSPVMDRNFEEDRIFYRATGPQLAINGGGEGGEDADHNVQLLSAVNQDIFSTDNIQNFYAQVYISFLRQDVNFNRQSVYREQRRYYPHLSLTGNWTRSQDIFRYYTGVIASETVKVYLGADYTFNTTDGWSFRGGGVGYLNPDRDYYSQIFGNVSKRFRLGNNGNLILSSFFNYAIDRETRIGDVVSISPASELALSGRLNWGIFSLGLTNYFGDILPNSYDDRLLIEFAVRPVNNITLSGYIAPIDKTSSRSVYGSSINWRLKNQPNSPTLSASWQHQEYDYGNDIFGNSLLVTDNIFTILFRVGSSPNPFPR
ncbi:hypothetical protein [Limnospira platensis]